MSTRSETVHIHDARAELAHTPTAQTLNEAEIYVMIDSLDDVGAALKEDKPENITQLYQQLRLELRYEPMSEPSSRRYRRVWLVRVSEPALTHIPTLIHRAKLHLP